MRESEYTEKTGKKPGRLRRTEVDVIAAGYEWACPCGAVHNEIETSDIYVCPKTGLRYRTGEIRHAEG